MTKLWGGRFEGDVDALMGRFNDSFPFDRRLYREDIEGSIAYAAALERAEVISAEERASLHEGLQAVLAEFETGQFAAQPGDEDIHTAVERRLHQLIGPVAGKLHTGRSRNDQVATDLRLYIRRRLGELRAELRGLQGATVELAERYPAALMPGYTHVQRAQPVLFAHWAMSWFWAWQRDVERLDDCLRRVSVSPLGSGALAGTPLAVDRLALAEALGFTCPSENSMDAVRDRDFVAEALFWAALLGVHLSQLAEDLVLWSSAEYGFVRLADAYSTGSSLMPQKRNPDSMELVRGKAGRLVGHLTGLLVTLKGLPSTYNKDLQEDKEPLFDTLDTLDLALPVVTGVLRTLAVRPERMAAALDDAMLATDLADYFVAQGLPFRQAHELVGRAVHCAEVDEVPLGQLSAEAWAELTDLPADGVRQVFSQKRAVNRRAALGGTAASAVAQQVRQARDILKSDQNRR